jgi:hypothetical protein
VGKNRQVWPQLYCLHSSAAILGPIYVFMYTGLETSCEGNVYIQVPAVSYIGSYGGLGM